MMKGQKFRVLEHLKVHNGLTSMEAFDKYGITRLAAVVCELRKLGYDIRTLDMESQNRYGEVTRYAKYILKGELDAEKV